MEKLNKISSEKKERAEDPVMSFEAVAQLLRASFLFSQGDPDIQINILKYARGFYGKQELNASQLDKIKDKFQKLTISTTDHGLKLKNEENKSHTEASTSTINNELTNLNTNYLTSLTDNEKVKPNLEVFADTIWSRDHYFLCQKFTNSIASQPKDPGRPNRDAANSGDNTIKDKWFSFAVNYILRDTPISEPAVQEMFQEIREANRAGSSSVLPIQYLNVVDTYNEHHPNTPLTDDELLSAGY